MTLTFTSSRLGAPKLLRIPFTPYRGTALTWLSLARRTRNPTCPHRGMALTWLSLARRRRNPICRKNVGQNLLPRKPRTHVTGCTCAPVRAYVRKSTRRSHIIPAVSRNCENSPWRKMPPDILEALVLFFELFSPRGTEMTAFHLLS